MGLFSRKQYADTIFINGTVETLDPDFPEAEAIAVKDGAVLALGDADDIEAFRNRDTVTVDLEGGCALPGFFTMNASVIRDAYSSVALPLSDALSAEEVLSELYRYVSTHPGQPLYCAFGYSDLLRFGASCQNVPADENAAPPSVARSEAPEGALPRELLDGIAPNVPLVCLSRSGASALVNTAALAAAHSSLAEELRAMEAAGEVRLVPQGRSSAADAVLRTRTDEGIDLDGEYDDASDPEDERSAASAPDGAVGDDSTEGALTDDLAKLRATNPWFLFRDILPGFQYFGRDENGVPTGLLEGPSTVSQFLNILGAFDETALSRAVVDASIAYAKKGYTTLLDSGAPDYFVRGFMSIATDLLQNGLSLQRNVVTTLVAKETDPYLALQRMAQRQTLCVECEDLLSAAAVRFDVQSLANGDSSLTPSYLEDYATRALDHGFDVLALADGLPAARACLDGLGAARGKARKGRLVVRLSGLTEQEAAELRDAFDTAEIPVIGEPKTPEQILSVLTGRERHLLRAFEDAGRIAVGAPADFTVLARSPFGESDSDSDPDTGRETAAEDPRNIPVLFTVLAGEVVSTDPADYELPDFASDDFGDFEDFEESNDAE